MGDLSGFGEAIRDLFILACVLGGAVIVLVGLLIWKW